MSFLILIKNLNIKNVYYSFFRNLAMDTAWIKFE